MTQFFQFIPDASATQGGTLTGPGTTQSLPGTKTALGAWTFQETITITKNSQAGAAEVLLTATTSDEVSGGKFQLENATATNAFFIPQLGFYGHTANTAGALLFQAVTDSGSVNVANFDARVGAAAAVVNRPLFSFRNNSVDILQLIPLNSGANAALSWGTQAVANPTVTARSAGVRLVLKATIDGTHVDDAVGVDSSGPYISMNAATSNNGITFYGGSATKFFFRGDGQLTTTGGKIRKVRIALTTPVTLAVTDDIVITKLTTPGPVAVAGFASPANGTEIVIQDGTGDANTNNITFTPAAGNVNGAASKAFNTAYGRWTLTYETTTPQWYAG